MLTFKGAQYTRKELLIMHGLMTNALAHAKHTSLSNDENSIRPVKDIELFVLYLEQRIRDTRSVSKGKPIVKK